ncbi:YjzD family protein [Bacillus smithii]|uniref:YjzD family protein n=1 Tax=Bacillus smithii TaxID=1479 RepID=UPI0030C9919A
MRFIMTLVWAFLLSVMLVYVVGAMAGAAFNFSLSLLLTFVFAILIFLLSSLIPDEPVEKH